MRQLKIFLSLIIVLCFCVVAVAAQTKKSSSKKKPSKPKPTKVTPTLKDDYKVIAEGNNIDVETPFIFVARDAETYSALQKLVPNLPQQDKSFFNSNTVVAVFLGTKPTAGYGVQITKGATIEVKAIEPPKGAITADVITSPYKVVAVPIINDETTLQNIELKTDAVWGGAWQSYVVTNGEMVQTGGFAPTEKHIPIQGTLGILRHGDFVTMRLNLNSSLKDFSGRMNDLASGVVDKDGNVKFTYLDPCTLIEPPRPMLVTTGKFERNNLRLNFESGPTIVSDGFDTKGKLEATKVKD
jgi:hypothetical protein